MINTKKKILNKLCLALLAAMLLSSMAGVGFISIFTKFNSSFSSQSVKVMAASSATIGYLILFQVFTSGMEKESLTTINKSMKFSAFDGIKYYVILLGGTTVLSFLGQKIVEGVMILSGHAGKGISMQGLVLNGVPLWLIFICVVVVSPIAEELLFRKVLLEKLLPYGDAAAIGFSSILFGMYHFNFQQLLYTSLMGLVCANIVIRTGKIRYAIYEHMLFNLFGGIVSDYIPSDFYITLIIKITLFIGATAVCVFLGKELFILKMDSKTKRNKSILKSQILSGGFLLFILVFLVSAVGALIDV